MTEQTEKSCTTADAVQLLMLSQQANHLKHTLDNNSNGSNNNNDSPIASRRNSMPLKKRHKSAGSFSGSSGTNSPTITPTITTTTVEVPTTVVTTPTITTLPPMNPIPTTFPMPFMASSLGALSALLGKPQTSPGDTIHLATRLEAFKEAQRRSRVSRELLARASSAGTATATTNALANLASQRLPSLSVSSLGGGGGTCSRSGSLASSAPLGQQTAMTSW